MEYRTKYAELKSLEDYKTLNKAISEVKGYPRNGTEIYAPIEPESVNGLYYMEIGSNLQDTWPEIFEGVTLVERIPEIEITEPE